MVRKTSMIRSLVLIAIVAVMASGCASYERKVQDSDYDYGARQSNDPKMLGSRNYGSTTGNPNQHDNQWVEYSSMLTNEVSGLNGVSSGLVFLTEKNAYVALMLDWTAVGTKTRGGGYMKEQNNGGMGEGVYDNDTGRPYWNNRQLATPYNSYYTVNDHNMLSPELKQRIASRIRGLAPRVQEVHISANMDFVNEMTEYAKEAWGGSSLTPWVEPFNILVKHQFAGGKIMPQSLQSIKAQYVDSIGNQKMRSTQD